MCLSATTLPLHKWSCPECVGLTHYDEQRRSLIAVLCQRVGEEKALTAEYDGFSQLVFDLSCTCNWSEMERNFPTLITLVTRQLTNGELPAIAPFHSLHYARQCNAGVEKGMHKKMIRQIAEANARHTQEEALKKLSSKERKRAHDGEGVRFWRPGLLKFTPGRRLRIGYLSSDFVDHPTADLILSALRTHDRTRFEIFAYSISQTDCSDQRKVFLKLMDHFVHFPQHFSDEQCARAIAQDGIHILVNLNGHTAGSRNGISALCPAPRQLLYLAYPGTMGASYINYNVTDKVVCPDHDREFYTEKLFYMPHCYQTNSFKELYGSICNPSTILQRRSDHQLPEEPNFVFCNFCRLGRITPQLFEVWMNILRRVPGSVIWLYKHPHAAIPRLQAEAVAAGVAHQRLVFGAARSPKMEHLKRVTLADLALDTLVYNGHTTASDMLWAGVPLITMRGDNWPSLVATSIVEAAEMHDLVVANLQAYEEKAVELATNPSIYKAVRDTLAQKRNTSPLFDTKQWIKHFEVGLDEVWRRYAEDDESASDLVVSAVRPGLTRRCLSEGPALPKDLLAGKLSGQVAGVADDGIYSSLMTAAEPVGSDAQVHTKRVVAKDVHLSNDCLKRKQRLHTVAGGGDSSKRPALAEPDVSRVPPPQSTVQPAHSMTTPARPGTHMSIGGDVCAIAGCLEGDRSAGYKECASWPGPVPREPPNPCFKSLADIITERTVSLTNVHTGQEQVMTHGAEAVWRCRQTGGSGLEDMNDVGNTHYLRDASPRHHKLNIATSHHTHQGSAQCCRQEHATTTTLCAGFHVEQQQQVTADDATRLVPRALSHVELQRQQLVQQQPCQHTPTTLPQSLSLLQQKHWQEIEGGHPPPAAPSVKWAGSLSSVIAKKASQDANPTSSQLDALPDISYQLPLLPAPTVRLDTGRWGGQGCLSWHVLMNGKL